MPERNIRDILRHELRCSGTVIRRLRQPNLLFVDGTPVRVIDRMGAGSRLDAWLSEPDDSTLIPENLPLSILFEDDHLLVVDKGDCIPVHPSSIHRSGTLANAIAWYLAEQGKPRRVRPVTRLDRNTSGITLFAKTAHAQFDLSRQSETDTFEKSYLGIATGIWKEEEGTLRLPIRRKPGSIIERETHPEGDPSVTHFKVLARFSHPTPCTLLRFRLETGRTHQIRVHCAGIGHPMLGDTLYGGPAWPGLAGQALHCDRLCFLHPITRLPIRIHSERKAPMFAFLAEYLQEGWSDA